MINKKFMLGALLATSLFAGQNAEAQGKQSSQIKSYLPVIAKAFEVAADKPEGAILWEFLDTTSAWLEKDPRPFAKKARLTFEALANMIKTPKKYTQEERIKALENFFTLTDEMTLDDKIIRFNDKVALAKAADILVNNSWSLPGQYLNSTLMFQRLMVEGLVAGFGDTKGALFKEFKTSNTILKRAWNHSVKEVTDALTSLEKNIPLLMTEILTKLENINTKNFKVKRDFKEYQVCLAYMPQPQIPAQA